MIRALLTYFQFSFHHSFVFQLNTFQFCHNKMYESPFCLQFCLSLLKKKLLSVWAPQSVEWIVFSFFFLHFGPQSSNSFTLCNSVISNFFEFVGCIQYLCLKLLTWFCNNSYVSFELAKHKIIIIPKIHFS